MYVAISNVNNYGYQALTNQLDEIAISGGSHDGMEQPQAGNITISCLNSTFGTAQVAPADLIGQMLKVKIVHPDFGAYEYTNYTITQVQMEAVDSDAVNNLLTITGTGAMGKLSRQFTNGTATTAAAPEYWAVNQISAQGSQTSWNEVNASITWGDLPSSATSTNSGQWADYDASLVDVVAVVGSANTCVSIPTVAGNTVLATLQDVANANDSWMWETNGGVSGVAPNGQVWYEDRLTLSQAAATTVDAGTLAVTGTLMLNIDQANLYNNVTITNGTSSGYAGDITSIVSLGNFPLTLDSYLSNAVDLQTMADAKLSAYAAGATSLSRLTFDLDLVTDSAVWAALITIGEPKNLTLNNLPTAYISESSLNPNAWQARGGDITFTTNHAEVTRTVVPFSVYAVGTTSWISVSASTAWNAYLTAATTWAAVA